MAKALPFSIDNLMVDSRTTAKRNHASDQRKPEPKTESKKTNSGTVEKNRPALGLPAELNSAMALSQTMMAAWWRQLAHGGTNSLLSSMTVPFLPPTIGKAPPTATHPVAVTEYYKQLKANYEKMLANAAVPQRVAGPIPMVMPPSAASNSVSSSRAVIKKKPETVVVTDPATSGRPCKSLSSSTSDCSAPIDNEDSESTGSSQLANKTFSCGECGKIFNAHYNLTRHMPVHTGARPFICKVERRYFSKENFI